MEKHVQKFGEYMRMVEEEEQNKRKIKNKTAYSDMHPKS